MTTQNQEDTDRKRPDVRAVDILDPNNQIGNRLRSFYAAVQDEAIPIVSLICLRSWIRLNV